MEVILLFVVFLNIILGIYVLKQNPKSLNNRVFSLMSLLAAIWTSANYMTNVSSSLFWFELSYALGSLVISTGLLWVLVMTKSNLGYLKIVGIYLIAIFLSVNSFIPGFITKSYQNLGYTPTYNSVGWGIGLYSIFYLIISILIIYILYSFERKTVDVGKKYQFRYIMIGAFVTLLTTAFSSFVFPFLSIFVSGAIDNIGFLFFMCLITYSIYRHQLFDIKVISLELVTFGLWIFILIRVILAKNLHDRLVEVLLFMIVFVFGILLIRSTLYEIEQRKKIETLTKNLLQAYKHLEELDFPDNDDKKKVN